MDGEATTRIAVTLAGTYQNICPRGHRPEDQHARRYRRSKVSWAE